MWPKDACACTHTYTAAGVCLCVRVAGSGLSGATFPLGL